MAAGTVLKKITAEAKRIRKKNPRMKWVSAVKQAGMKYRSGKIRKPKKRVSAVKLIEKGESRNAKPSKVLRVNRSKAGTFKGYSKVGAVINKSSIASYYKTELAKLLLKRDLEKGVRNKRVLSKEIAKTRRALKSVM